MLLAGISTVAVAEAVSTDVMPSVNDTGVEVVCPTGTSVEVALAMSVVGRMVVGSARGSVDDVTFKTGSVETGSDVVRSAGASADDVTFATGSVGTGSVVAVGSVGAGRAVGVGITMSDVEKTGTSAEVALAMGPVMFVGIATSLEMKETMGSKGLVGLLVSETEAEVVSAEALLAAAVDRRAVEDVSTGRTTELARDDTSGSVVLTLGIALGATALDDVSWSETEVRPGSLVEVVGSTLDVGVTTPVGAKRIPDEDTDVVGSDSEVGAGWVLETASMLVLASSEVT